MKVLVIIPAYNEEANIADVLRKTKSYFPDLDILVVDDGSNDGTARIAKDSGALVIMHPFNLGYGVALQTGYKYADINKYDFVVQMDGDGQHDPKYIKELFEEVKNGTADVIIGSRFISDVEVKYDAPLNRRIGMFLFSKLVSLIVRHNITDSTSGFQALNRKTFKFLTSEIYPCDYPDADVIIMLHRAGFRIKEIPLVMYRKYGQKSIHSGLKPIYYIFKMALSIFVTLLRSMPKSEERKGD